MRCRSIAALALIGYYSVASLAVAQTTTTVAGPKKIQVPAGVLLIQDVAYLSPERSQKLDIYLPTCRQPDELSPAVVIIHGGGWVGGDKAARREQVTGSALAQEGYVGVSIEYMREAGKRWPTNLHDCKNAVRWLRVNAQRLQIDPDRIGVIGGSAGGHLALMVAYTSGIEELEPPQPYPGVSSAVQACVNMYGITNLLTRQGVEKDGIPNGNLSSMTALFPQTREEAPELWKFASPVTHVGPGSPPTLITHGTADATVDRDQAHELVEVLSKHGVEHQFLEIPGGPHSYTLSDKRLPGDLRPDVIGFFDRHLKVKNSKPAQAR